MSEKLLKYFFTHYIEVFLYHQRPLKIGLLNYNEKNIALCQQSVSQAQILAPQVNETSNKGNNPKMDAVIYFTHLNVIHCGGARTKPDLPLAMALALRQLCLKLNCTRAEHMKYDFQFENV